MLRPLFDICGGDIKGYNPDVLKTIDEAKVYAEGRGLRLEVRKKRDIETMKKLAVIKMAN